MSFPAFLAHKKILLALLALKTGGTLCLAAFLLARRLRQQAPR
ncbi:MULTISPECIES: hypothetical protein [unclassified Desulfovibrio]|nr:MULTISPECIES: hypothetical protein [unclassified Desulfovibrio]